MLLNRLKFLLPVLCLLILSACATQDLNHQILLANQSLTIIVKDTDLALNGGLITPDQAQSVSTIAHQVNPLLDSARVAAAQNDIPGATKLLKLVNALLAGMQQYLPQPPP